MKASEVLQRYRAGERNFQGENLRGQSFKNEVLSGADFSRADIRSSNFTGATLIGAKFSNTKCGTQKRWAVSLTIISLLLAGISPLSLFLAIILFYSFDVQQIVTWIIPIVLIIFLFLTFCQDLKKLLIVPKVAAGITGVIQLTLVLILIKTPILARISLGIVTTLVITTLVVTVVSTIVIAIIGIAAGVAATRLVAGVTAAKLISKVAIVVAVEVAVIMGHLKNTPTVEELVVAIAATVAATVAIVSAAIYNGWHLLKNDKKNAWLRSLVIDFIATGGTSFYNAELTEADFTGAKLKGTDLREANLSEVNLTGACIKDWIINSQTNLDDVICDYIYLKEGQQERHPASGNFAPEEFSKLVKAEAIKNLRNRTIKNLRNITILQNKNKL